MRWSIKDLTGRLLEAQGKDEASDQWEIVEFPAIINEKPMWGNFWIWEEYKPGSTYMLSADVARGDGQDYSVFHIVKIETMEIIAELFTDWIPVSPMESSRMAENNRWASSAIIMGGDENPIT